MVNEARQAMLLARVGRGEFMSLKQRDFVEAARSIGVPDATIIRRHLLPNVLAAIIVATTLNIAYSMLSEATLSFLGFGVPPETPTWGNMLSQTQTYLTTAPWLAMFPGLMIFLVVLCINYLGDAPVSYTHLTLPTSDLV